MLPNTGVLMAEDFPPSKDKFLSPRSRYYGDFDPEELLFNDNLQEFAARIGYICALETGGKISGAEAYKQIKAVWKELKQSKKSLGIEDTPSNKA